MPGRPTLGIDPSQRHTGICLLKTDGSAPKFKEIKPTQEDLLGCGLYLFKEFADWMIKNVLPEIDSRMGMIVGIEKQGRAGRMPITMVHMQLMCMAALKKVMGETPLWIVSPLPIQLKSYMRAQHGVDLTSKQSIVDSFKRRELSEENQTKRISQHCVEAFYLARLGKDVTEGKWEYARSAWELKLYHWDVIHKGDECRVSPSK